MTGRRSWRETLIAPAATIHEAIAAIDRNAQQICLVVDAEGRLQGTVTDGDIRRGILRQLDLAHPVTEVMNRRPLIGRPGDGRDALLAQMTARSIHHIPLVDAEGRVIGLASLDDFLSGQVERDNWVVLMAGGLGTRLRPLTERAPKPLLAVGNKPILETILESFLAFDFRRFYIAVNYKAAMIKDHFGDGGRWNATIRYVEEREPLGTAGALRLIPERPPAPFVVMNADLLTRVNFRQLLDYHRQHESRATMCVREYDFQVPFGVVQLEDNRILGIDEKPVHRFFVNAGIYVLDPALLDLIPEGRAFDMTSLFEAVIAGGQPTAVFPIREYWLDVGQIDEFQQANWEYPRVFGR